MVFKATKPIINNQALPTNNSKYLLDLHMGSVMSIVINFREKILQYYYLDVLSFIDIYRPCESK